MSTIMSPRLNDDKSRSRPLYYGKRHDNATEDKVRFPRPQTPDPRPHVPVPVMQSRSGDTLNIHPQKGHGGTLKDPAEFSSGSAL
jgi:hypothetical protein